ncbi:MAG: type II secretion system F family protein, partial [Lachnospiraceae bacterium]|nr:type II secretion system F family protein [Lachnospiraceae bacterium]
MADFNYLVIDPTTGKEKKGNIQAETKDVAMQQLKSQGLAVISLEKANALTKEINISFGSSIKPRDLSVFCRQFISMVKAGVTILDTLNMLTEQTENKTMAKAIEGVHAEIQKGETLSDALAKYPKVFPDIMVSMVAAGEASGKIDVAFERMAEHFEKSAKMKAMIKKASVYPIMVAIVALAVVVVMLVKVIPAYEDMFEQMGGQLPAITRAVVAMSDSLMAYWYIYLIVVVGIVIGYKVFAQTVTGQIVLGKLARKAPVFGKLNVKNASSNFARTLSTLVYSGLPMMEALAITANTMSNYIYKQALIKAREEISKGIPLSEPIMDCG